MAKKKKLQTNQARYQRAKHHKGTLKRYSQKAFLSYVNSCKHESIKLSSKDEEIFLAKLNKMNKYRLMDRQLHLTNYTRKGKTHRYFVDFIILDHRHHVTAIEIKDFCAMADIDTKRKYISMQNFCAQMGFAYMLITKNFTSYEQIKKMKYNQQIYEYMKECFKRHGKFTSIDLKQLKSEMHYKNPYLNEQITIISIANHLYMKGNPTIKNKILCIKPLR